MVGPPNTFGLRHVPSRHASRRAPLRKEVEAKESDVGTGLGAIPRSTGRKKERDGRSQRETGRQKCGRRKSQGTHAWRVNCRVETVRWTESTVRNTGADVRDVCEEIGRDQRDGGEKRKRTHHRGRRATSFCGRMVGRGTKNTRTRSATIQRKQNDPADEIRQDCSTPPQERCA